MKSFAPRRASALPASVPPRRLGGLRRPPSPRFPFPFFLKNARVFFKSVMEKRGEGRAAVFMPQKMIGFYSYGKF